MPRYTAEHLATATNLGAGLSTKAQERIAQALADQEQVGRAGGFEALTKRAEEAEKRAAELLRECNHKTLLLGRYVVRAEAAEAKLRVEYCGYSQCTHPNCRAVRAETEAKP